MNTDENTTTPESKDSSAEGQTLVNDSKDDVQPPAAQAAPSAPNRNVRSREDDYEEEPGDDIGNRAPGAPRGDFGNRRSGPQPQQRGARPQGPPPKQQQQQHQPRPQPQRSPERAAPVASAPAPAPAQPQAEDSAVAEASSGAPAAAPSGDAAQAPAKKKRRRRRKGGSGAAPNAGAAASTTSTGGAVDAADEGEETEGQAAAADEEHEASDEHAAQAEADAAEDEAEAAPQGASHGGGGSEGRRRRKGQPPPSASRERPAFSVGEEVFGKVYRVTDDAIWIDIAGKATGLFDRRELLDEPPAEGDQFIATVGSTGVRGGMLVLSRAPAKLDEARALLEAASKSGEPVTGFVTGAVKGGLEVDLGGLRAFAPASHVDLRHGADLSYLVGQRFDFIVTQYAKKGRDVVVSRKKMLEEDSQRARAQAMSKIEPGSVHKGIVRKIVAWGVFVTLPDAGGAEGLVHMSEASHDRGARLGDLFKPGAEIEVKVIRVDEKGKLWLSRKAITADPWDKVKEKYAVGSRHKGKIARLQPFGAFIELEPGIDGLCHTSDLSLKPIQHPQEVVKVGDEIEVVVASCDSGAHKISLHPAPPSGEEGETRQRVQQGKTLKVAVTQVTEGGLVVRILGVTGRSSRAFIPAGHTGTQRGTDLRKEFPIDTRLEAKVIEVDPRRGEAKLSIRAMKEDAEKQAYQQYRAGVAREAKFGTFADLMKKS